jgi:hypothetical protein
MDDGDCIIGGGTGVRKVAVPRSTWERKCVQALLRLHNEKPATRHSPFSLVTTELMAMRSTVYMREKFQNVDMAQGSCEHGYFAIQFLLGMYKSILAHCCDKLTDQLSKFQS